MTSDFKLRQRVLETSPKKIFGDSAWLFVEKMVKAISQDSQFFVLVAKLWDQGKLKRRDEFFMTLSNFSPPTKPFT